MLRGMARGWWRLGATDRALALEAAAVMWATRVLLPALGARAVERLLGSLPRGGRPAAAVAVEAAVRRAARTAPRATCLVKALAAVALLRRRLEPARLVMGFERDPDGALRGHAWVETRGAVVDVSDGLRRYAPAAAARRGR